MMLVKTTYDIFSQNQCGFRKGFSVANCLLPMTEKWRESLGQGGAYGTKETSQKLFTSWADYSQALCLWTRANQFLLK